MAKIAPALILACALLPGAAAAQSQPNILTNPSFDHDLGGWLLINHPTHSTADADDSANSGSATASIPSGAPQGGSALSQCFPLAPSDAGNTVDLSFKVMVANPADNSSPLGGTAYYANTRCTGVELAGTRTIFPPSDLHLHVWQTLHAVSTIPAGSGSVGIFLSAAAASGGGAQTISWDDVYFGPRADSSCAPGSTLLCLDNNSGDQRFGVASYYSTVQGGGSAGQGQTISLSSLGVGQGGVFWFFDHSNPEMLVKVHNACPSGYFWIFISAGTNVGVDLYVEDTVTGAVTFFHNPDQSSFPTIHDFLALPCT
ncbi:MAG TPA: hypothetical protein VKA53_06810 [Thermoanaerobaculia bacterium]|nr:hypothetical protein [Thermoanaerobaculia bacterium]